MFLQQLSESEKEASLELAHLLANSDLNLSEEEMSYISQYRNEMELPEETYQIKDLTTRQSIQSLSKSKSQIKNMIYFELLGLAPCDENFDKKEMELLQELREGLQIN